MDYVTVISRRATAYGRAHAPVMVVRTPRIEQLIRLNVFRLAPVQVRPKQAAKTRPRRVIKMRPPKRGKDVRDTKLEPVIGVTSAPAGTDALVSDPIDHEGSGEKA